MRSRGNDRERVVFGLLAGCGVAGPASALLWHPNNISGIQQRLWHPRSRTPSSIQSHASVSGIQCPVKSSANAQQTPMSRNLLPTRRPVPSNLPPGPTPRAINAGTGQAARPRARASPIPPSQLPSARGTASPVSCLALIRARNLSVQISPPCAWYSRWSGTNRAASVSGGFALASCLCREASYHPAPSSLCSSGDAVSVQGTPIVCL